MLPRRPGARGRRLGRDRSAGRPAATPRSCSGTTGSTASSRDLHGFDVSGRVRPGQAAGQDRLDGRRATLAPCLTYKGAYVLVDRRVTPGSPRTSRVDWRDAVHTDGTDFVYESHTLRATVGGHFEMTSRIIAQVEYTCNRELGGIPQFPERHRHDLDRGRDGLIMTRLATPSSSSCSRWPARRPAAGRRHDQRLRGRREGRQAVHARRRLRVPRERARRRSSHAGARRGLKREIRQKDETFVPHVLVVPVGAEVAFPNLRQRTNTTCSRRRDPPFDLGRYSTDKKGKLHSSRIADEFDIFCDIHRAMWAKVKVVDSRVHRPGVRTATSRSRMFPPARTRSSRGRPTAPRSKSEHRRHRRRERRDRDRSSTSRSRAARLPRPQRRHAATTRSTQVRRRRLLTRAAALEPATSCLARQELPAARDAHAVAAGARACYGRAPCEAQLLVLVVVAACGDDLERRR